MDDLQASQMMAKFGKAFFSRDPAQLARVITEDAQWHFAIGHDAPNGRVRIGLAGFLQGIAENDTVFEHLKFLDVRCRAIATDQILMTYRLDGKYRAGESFSLLGVELITVRDEKVALKDVYWKQQA
jgi:ketosteroid isomerase-like protein